MDKIVAAAVAAPPAPEDEEKEEDNDDDGILPFGSVARRRRRIFIPFSYDTAGCVVCCLCDGMEEGGVQPDCFLDPTFAFVL